MLGRKQSIKLGDTTLMGDQNGISDSGANLIPGTLSGAQVGVGVGVSSAAPNAVELTHAASTGIAWFNKTSVRHFMRICSVASLISVCANTSRTFSWYPTLMLITFVVDIITGLVFTFEMAFKIYSRGLLNGPNPYARDRWCQFDATMVLFIWISILLQVSGYQRQTCGRDRLVANGACRLANQSDGQTLSESFRQHPSACQRVSRSVPDGIEWSWNLVGGNRTCLRPTTI